jgi:hypothetical protein
MACLAQRLPSQHVHISLLPLLRIFLLQENLEGVQIQKSTRSFTNQVSSGICMPGMGSVNCPHEHRP